MIVKGIRITNDYVFKKVFQDTQILSDLVSSIIGEKIFCVKIGNSEILPESIGNKLSRLDILAETDSGEQINVEMQLSYNKGFDDRMAFYGMRLHTRNLKEGEVYQSIKRTVIIDILDFVHPALEERKDFCTDFRLRSPDGAVTLTDKFVVYFVEIPKIPEGALENLTKLEKWFLFLKNEGGKDVIKTLKREPMIAKAITVASALAKDKRERMIAQYREDAIRDELWRRTASKEEGIEQGISLGMVKEKFATARKMLDMGVSLDIISQATGLSESEIRG